MLKRCGSMRRFATRAALIVPLIGLTGWQARATLAATADQAQTARFEVNENQRAKAVDEANRGWEKESDGKHRVALEHYLTALRLDPGNRAARVGLANLLSLPGLSPEPISPAPYEPAWMLETTARDKERAAKLVGHAWKNARQGENRSALEEYIEALGLDPRSRAARQGLVEVIGPSDPATASAPAAGSPPAPEARPAVTTTSGRGSKSKDKEKDHDQVLGRVAGAPDGPIDTEGPFYGVAKPYLSRVEHSADHHGVDPRLVLAVIMVESGFGPNARSSSGARGLMQLMPATAAKYGAQNIDDPYENIDAGTRYLRYLLDLFEGDVDRALAAYNSGEMTVVQAHGVPSNPGVQKFVRDVKAYCRQF